jgi:hypothetical protein
MSCQSTAKAALSSQFSHYFVAPQYVCDNNFEGAGWVLVRRVKQGSTWHPATDNLRGTDSYGSYGTATSDASFSVPFSSLIASSETLFLFANGKSQLLDVQCVSKNRYGFVFMCMLISMFWER